MSLAEPALATCHGGTSNPLNEVHQNGTAGRGVKSGVMAVYNGTVTCGRVSSLFVSSPDRTDFVEVGWMENPSGGYRCSLTFGAPEQLAYQELDGLWDCVSNPLTIAEGTDEFAVRDDNQDGYWNYTHNSSQFWTGSSMGSFNSGIPQNNGERLTTGNTSHSDFNSMQKRDSATTWVGWSGAFYLGGDDPGAKSCFYGSNHQAVKLNATPC